MANYQYQLFIPGGNKTALVFGIADFIDDMARRKLLQDKIQARHLQDMDGEVEQVGFVSTDKNAPTLIMAGGEFCGNAARAAVAHYLYNSTDEIVIIVSGATNPLSGGQNANGEIGVEMPLGQSLDETVTTLQNRAFAWVCMDGISHLVVSQQESVRYLQRISACESKEQQIEIALSLLEKVIAENGLPVQNAYGVMFLEDTGNGMKMHPFVHVKTVGTTYYETACGSGAMAVGLVMARQSGKGGRFRLVQPTGKEICAEVKLDTNGMVRGKILGFVEAGAVFDIKI